ncbi:aminotransferase class V-fold PLP-dependent enzyme [Pelotomaculum isophthalicicum JI]|uniref:Aminotransferase class V-fold PLP-dependent enzyme n=1 Tax=Pelotomaculum isophthalicicum JI TaxID=947010 RepID=A0A9X4H021_9FIRM|nr:aminotransferase class V-fold PLP-dependent enzyme [Pelotomaculum isophthalicicum]MDF9406906.1 aminotransferase class V-fold PLP-dependent enzyme [Pelotomaculum isophthalicicum JI]
MVRSAFRELVVGVDAKVPLHNGNWVTSINMDNAATTPPFVQALQEIIQFAPMYSSVHRGAGYKSRLSTELYENSRLAIANFVKADLNHDTVIFLRNTTEAINKLSYRLCDDTKKSVILSTCMEHHSNDLPWRNKHHVDYIEIDNDGRLCLDDLVNKLKKYKRSVKLVAVTGASNVTGYVNPIYEIAEIAHQYNAKIFVDGAQLVPHAQIDMKPFNSPRHIDYLAFSGHKMYAPFGTGVLIGPKETFMNGAPEYTGGGTVRTVTHTNVVWDDPPNKEEAGTPNLMGVLSLQAAVKTLSMIGMQNISNYELGLWKNTIDNFKNIPGLQLYSDTNPDKPRIGIISFNLEGIHHTLVADILAGETGIAVRSGCFCAQPYVRELLKISEKKESCIREHRTHSRPLSRPLNRPGMIRVSFGLYNDFDEISVLVQALHHIVNNKERYIQKYMAI